MILLPAIDILDARPVRLYQGDYNKKEIVASSVLDTAQEFEKKGASWLHLVDLEGAKKGCLVHHEIIGQVAKTLSIPVEVGGGIRTLEDATWYLEHGISRVIIGTSALQDRNLLEILIQRYGEKIAVGIDCKEGYVCGSGWLETSEKYYLDFAKDMEKIGVKTLIVTDIAKDGTLSGPNLKMLEELSNNVRVNLIASGGVRDKKDIEALRQLNLYGAIAGKALYSGTLSLEEVL